MVAGAAYCAFSTDTNVCPSLEQWTRKAYKYRSNTNPNSFYKWLSVLKTCQSQNKCCEIQNNANIIMVDFPNSIFTTTVIEKNFRGFNTPSLAFNTYSEHEYRCHQEDTENARPNGQCPMDNYSNYWSPVVAKKSCCDNGWIVKTIDNRNFCFKHAGTMDIAEAESSCKDYDAELPLPKTCKENEDLRLALLSMKSQAIWAVLGTNDLQEEGKFVDAQNKKIKFANWNRYTHN